MKAKKVLKRFYELDLAKEEDAIAYFHEDCQLHWNSSQGFTILDYEGFKSMLEDIRKSFISFKYRLSHLLEDGKTVTARYTIYVTPIETPNEEEPLAHFIAIWQVKKGKLFKGYEISQLANEDPASIISYSEIKI